MVFQLRAIEWEERSENTGRQSCTEQSEYNTLDTFEVWEGRYCMNSLFCLKNGAPHFSLTSDLSPLSLSLL